MHAFIFVVVSVVWAAPRVAAEELRRLVFVQGHRAPVAVGVLVILIEFTAFAVRFMLISVLRKIHKTPKM